MALIVGLPAAALAGPIFGKMIGERFELRPPEYLRQIAAMADSELPSIGITLGTILFPLVLMIGNTLFQLAVGPHNPALPLVKFIGQPVTALFLAVFLAYFTMGLNRGLTMVNLQKLSETAIGPMAAILLVIGASGAFNQILLDSGIGGAIKTTMEAVRINPLVLAWCVAAVMRISVGGATIAMVAAAGLVIPVLPLYPSVDPALVAVAIGAGAIGFSHVNDPGFWFVKEYFGMEMGPMFKSYTLSTTIAGVVSLFTLLAFQFAIG